MHNKKVIHHMMHASTNSPPNKLGKLENGVGVHSAVSVAKFLALALPLAVKPFGGLGEEEEGPEQPSTSYMSGRIVVPAPSMLAGPGNPRDSHFFCVTVPGQSEM
jgi:hypothetical protein